MIEGGSDEQLGAGKERVANWSALSAPSSPLERLAGLRRAAHAGAPEGRHVERCVSK